MSVDTDLAKAFSLIRQLQGALGGRRIVTGIINTTSPTIVSGEGFSVNKNGTGDVTVTFDTPFSETPRVQVTVRNTSVLIGQLVTAATSSAARVGINSTAASPTDSEFHFEATGK